MTCRHDQDNGSWCEWSWGFVSNDVWGFRFEQFFHEGPHTHNSVSPTTEHLWRLADAGGEQFDVFLTTIIIDTDQGHVSGSHYPEICVDTDAWVPDEHTEVTSDVLRSHTWPNNYTSHSTSCSMWQLINRDCLSNTDRSHAWWVIHLLTLKWTPHRRRSSNWFWS